MIHNWVQRYLLFTLTLCALTLAGRAEAEEGGYTNRTSVAAGDSLIFFISTTVSPFNLSIYRLDEHPISVATIASVQGGIQPLRDSSYWYGCNWHPTVRMQVPSDWVPGVYEAQFPVSLGEIHHVLFIVRPVVAASVSKMLVLLSVNTVQAYNGFGGKSLYDFNSNGHRSAKVSFERPVATSYGVRNAYKWELELVQFLAVEHFDVEYAGDNDLAANPALLDPYQTVITVGHDEYWSRDQRDAVSGMLRRGGYAANFGGNTCWWQVRFEQNFRTMVCYKDARLDPLTGIDDPHVTVNWYNSPVSYPENLLFGASYRNGGYVADGPVLPESLGYGGLTAFNTQHWIYQGTGLSDGEVFGREETVAGYEVDGALFSWRGGRPVVNGTDLSPAQYRILALSPASDSHGNPQGHCTMGMYRVPEGGVLFNAGTIDWADGLRADTVVRRITRNILRRFSDSSIPPEITGWSPSLVVPDTANHEPIYRQGRNLLASPGQTLKFSVQADDRDPARIRYAWKFQDSIVSTDSIAAVTLQEMLPRFLLMTAYVYNDRDTSTISWNIEIDSSAQQMTVPLNEGYNMVAWPGAPVDSSITYLFNGPLERRRVKSILTWERRQGNRFLYSFYVPELGPYNQIQTIGRGKGCVVNLFKDAPPESVSFVTRAVGVPAPIVLEPGINFVPNVMNHPVPLSSIAANLRNGNLQTAFDYVNVAGIPAHFDFYPEGGLTEFKPGKTYFLRVAETDTLEWPLGPSAPRALPMQVTSADSFSFTTLPGFQPAMCVFGVHVSVNGKMVRAGTIVKAITRSGKLCGTGQFTADGVFSVVLMGDDPSTPAQEGAAVGEPVNLYFGNLLVIDSLRWTSFADAYDFSGNHISTGLTIADGMPTDFLLEQNFPNPFNGTTRIIYYIPRMSTYTLTIFNILGQEVRTFAAGAQEEGWNSIVFDGTNNAGVVLPSGVYVYALQGQTTDTHQRFSLQNKLILSK